MTEKSTGVRKQRMGVPHQASQPTKAEPTEAGRTTRMGVSQPQRTRMAHGTANPPQPSRTRMGASDRTETEQAVEPQRRRMQVTQTDHAATAEPTIMSTSVKDQPTPEPPSRRRPRSRLLRTFVWGCSLLIAATVIVLIARWLRAVPEVAAFIAEYPGSPTMPESTPVGLPAWMGWQHFFNMFFMVLIVRTGLQVRHEKKVPAHFTAKKNSFFSPKSSTPQKVSLSQWLHQALDVFWIVNGVVFIVLLFATGQWLKIVPTDWDTIPHALSAALQYATLDWPQENGWVHYNALQMIAYTTTVFIAAPLAIVSGLRFSTWWPDTNAKLSKAYPVEIARAIHYPVMLYFVAFTLVHVLLVFLTGTLRNLNHMYTSRDTSDWLGLIIFLGSLLVIVSAWFLTKPIFMRPIAQRFGTLTK